MADLSHLTTPDAIAFRVGRLADHVDRLADLLASVPTTDDRVALLTRRQVADLLHLAHEATTLANLYGPD